MIDRARLRWAAAGVWAAVMALHSLSATGWLLRLLSGFARQGEELGLPRDGFYAALHCGGFALLGVLLANALRASELSGRRALSAALVGLSLYAALLEGLQAFVPRRHVDPLDLLANLVGAGLGFCLTWRLRGAETPAPPA